MFVKSYFFLEFKHGKKIFGREIKMETNRRLIHIIRLKEGSAEVKSSLPELQ